MGNPSSFITLSLVGSLVLAGCLSGLPAGSDSNANIEQGTICEDAGVSFAATNDYYWEPNLVRIGTQLPARSSVLLVVFENDTVLGVRNDTTGSDPGHGSVGIVWLDRNLTGNHTVEVGMYLDTDENGAFNSDTDQQCRNENGNVIRAGPRTFNFSNFTGNRSWGG